MEHSMKKKESLVLRLLLAIAAAIILINVVQNLVMRKIMYRTASEETEDQIIEKKIMERNAIYEEYEPTG